MADGGRRKRILAQLGDPDLTSSAADAMGGVCRFAVSQLRASGCALMLMSQGTIEVVASAGSAATTVADLQSALGEGPCLDAHTSGSAVFAADLAACGARWPVFSAEASGLGVAAEFALPLQVGAAGLGTMDLSRHEPGMLSEDDLADALAAADIAVDALLALQRTAVDGGVPAGLNALRGADRLVVHQATGMVSVQLEVTTTAALASMRAAAFNGGRSMHDIAVDVVERRLRFRD